MFTDTVIKNLRRTYEHLTGNQRLTANDVKYSIVCNVLLKELDTMPWILILTERPMKTAMIWQSRSRGRKAADQDKKHIHQADKRIYRCAC